MEERGLVEPRVDGVSWNPNALAQVAHLVICMECDPCEKPSYPIPYKTAFLAYGTLKSGDEIGLANTEIQTALWVAHPRHV